MSDNPLKIEQRYDVFGRDSGYTVDGRHTVSKVLALEWAGGDLSRIRYRWEENNFDAVDWTQEPQESLQSMVDRAVQEIRATHDYVTLWFSGGYDSYTIYEAFRRNGLRIDEFVLMFRDWDHGDLKTDADMAVRTAKIIKETVWPDLRLTPLHWGQADLVYQFYLDRGLDWIYHSGEILRFSKHSRGFQLENNPELQRWLHRPGRHISINGLDKPKLDIVDGHWVACRNDRTFYSEFSDWSLQFWFLPELYVKQTWMMIQWLESLPYFSHSYLHDLQSHRLPTEHYRDWNLAIGRDLPILPYCQGNAEKKIWEGNRHCIESLPLLENSRTQAAQAHDIYIKGIDYIESRFKDIMTNGQFPALQSKKYRVKPVKGSE